MKKNLKKPVETYLKKKNMMKLMTKGRNQVEIPSSLVEEKARQSTTVQPSSHKDVCHHLSKPNNPDKSKIVSISLDPSKIRQVEYGEYGGHGLVTLAPPKTLSLIHI